MSGVDQVVSLRARNLASKQDTKLHMDKLIPVLTEKSLEMAKDGKYTFWVDPGLTKHKIKVVVGEVFGVTVKTVKTLNYKARTKSDLRRRKKSIRARKKAIVTLGGKDKIDLFETKK